MVHIDEGTVNIIKETKGDFDIKDTNECVCVLITTRPGYYGAITYIEAYVMLDGDINNRVYDNMKYVDPEKYIVFKKREPFYKSIRE
jgi:hypothetical protein